MREITSLTCPYCRESLIGITKIRNCSACDAPHHSSCWKEYGRCSVYGCKGKSTLNIVRFWFLLPSIVLTASMLDHLAAAVLSPFFLPAFLLLVIEVFYFGIVLLEDGFVRRILNVRQLYENGIYFVLNLIPFGLRAAGINVQ